MTARDRSTFAPDARLRAALFRPAGNPGAVLVHGEIRGTWRARQRGDRLVVETDVPDVRIEDTHGIAAGRGARSVSLIAPRE